MSTSIATTTVAGDNHSVHNMADCNQQPVPNENHGAAYAAASNFPAGIEPIAVLHQCAMLATGWEDAAGTKDTTTITPRPYCCTDHAKEVGQSTQTT